MTSRFGSSEARCWSALSSRPPSPTVISTIAYGSSYFIGMGFARLARAPEHISRSSAIEFQVRRIHSDGTKPKNMGQLQNIDHIVVLMLENRSFDCLLGKLY